MPEHRPRRKIEPPRLPPMLEVRHAYWYDACSAAGVTRRDATQPRERGRELPWWVAEVIPCAFCLQHHGASLELHCARCARAACPYCIVQLPETLERCCPDCASPEES